MITMVTCHPLPTTDDNAPTISVLDTLIFCPKGPPIPSEVPPDETWARSCLDLCPLDNPF